MTDLAHTRRGAARRELSAAGPRLGAAAGTAEAPTQRVIWRSRRVAYLKLMLPAVALLIVTLILAWPQIVRDENRVRFGGGRISVDDAETLRMINARYVGVDDQQRPFVVTSALATRESAHAPHTDLQTPKADMTTSTGSWVAVTAETGVFHNDVKLLDLSGDVSVFHDGGTEFHTARAHVDLNAGAASGDDPIDGQGPTSTITAEGFRLYDRGGRIVFTGKAHLLLYHGEVRP
ncbi:MAG: LPS export ABC transporter periplasmic protein LptC [Proteobacteria bacterium]|nr:LPS export ABC transporter periplasmic protein LptC [Pseudomonadota bacterium]